MSIPDFVQIIELDPSRRVIFISDIHGHLTLFQELLKKLSFTADDVLMIAGDLVEKGPRNLDTLRYTMELCRTHTVYMVQGNCDIVMSNAFEQRYDNQLHDYIASRPCTIREMCECQGIALTAPLSEIRTMMRECYTDELAWLQVLPAVLVSDRFYVSHAGMNCEVLSELDARYCISKYEFIPQAPRFSKPLIVGHWPACIYRKSLIDHGVYYDADRHIYSIDGGNVVKRSGQINALLFNPDNSVETVFADALPRGQCAAAQEESASSLHLPWPPIAVTVEREAGQFSLCRTAEGVTVWHPTDKLWPDEGKLWLSDATDYRLPVKAGELVGIVECYEDRVLAKSGSRVGWVYGSVEPI